MTPEAQQIAIALARGWTKPPGYGDLWPYRIDTRYNDNRSVLHGIPPGETYKRWTHTSSGGISDNSKPVPDYLNDFNACADLIAFMELRGYSCVLVAQAGKRRCSFIDAAYAADFTVIADKFETAICEAFLKAMNLWKE